MSGPQNCQCMCGAVTFSATPRAMTMTACHCEMCRKWAGGVFLSTLCDDVTFAEDAPLLVCKSSDWAERLSCGKCGSTLVWRTTDSSGGSVSIQAFDDPAVFAFKSEIFIDKKPDNYAFGNPTEKMTEAEVIAKFAPSAGDN